MYVKAKTAKICVHQRHDLTTREMVWTKKLMTYVKSYINPQKSQVAPMMAIFNIRIELQELVGGPVCTVLAVIQSVRVRDVTTRLVDELAQILLAWLTPGRYDGCIFDGRTRELSPPDRWMNE
jgi:hypothetical protein